MITYDSVRISISRAPIRLPDSVDKLARAVVATCKRPCHHRRLRAVPLVVSWGQPGRPISAQRLKLRLNRLGIRPQPSPQHRPVPSRHRGPAAILARTLGISVSSAVRWQQMSAGDWTTYAADLSRRRPSQGD